MLNYVKDDLVDLRGNHTVSPNNGHNGYSLPKRNLKDIDTVTIHHDAIPLTPTYSSIARFEQVANMHTRQQLNDYGEPKPLGINYHFGVDNAGQWFLLQPLWRILYANGGPVSNKRSVAVVYNGYFHPPYNNQPTREQLEVAQQIMGFLRSQGLNIQRARFIAHREVPTQTACCGDKLHPFVVEYRNKGAINIPSAIKYAFPQYQPQPTAPKPPAITPKPVPQLPSNATPSYITKLEPHTERYVVGAGGAKLVKIGNDTAALDDKGKPVTWKLNDEISVVQRAYKGVNKIYLITEFSADRYLWNGIVGDLKLKTAADKPANHQQNGQGDLTDPKVQKQIDEMRKEIERQGSIIAIIVDALVKFAETIVSKLKGK